MARTVFENLSIILILYTKVNEKTSFLYETNITLHQIAKSLEVLTCKMLLMDASQFYKVTDPGLTLIKEEEIKSAYARM